MRLIDILCDKATYIINTLKTSRYKMDESEADMAEFELENKPDEKVVKAAKAIKKEPYATKESAISVAARFHEWAQNGGRPKPVDAITLDDIKKLDF